jgi:hypothetical protein
MRAALALICAILMCCASLRGHAQAPPADTLEVVTHVRLAAERLEYSGLITREANAALFDLYESADPKPRSLLIGSQGGSADAGMDLGSWIFEHALQVEVDTYCLSSCANYVFPAGRARLLGARAALMWHGGVTQPISAQELEAVLDLTLADLQEQERRELLAKHSRAELIRQLQYSLAEIVARETLFFAKIGVDQRITRLGHLYERELLRGRGRYPGWDFSLEDMGRLGIREIRIKDGAAWEPRCPIEGQQIYRIRLDELTNFAPRLPAT